MSFGNFWRLKRLKNATALYAHLLHHVHLKTATKKTHGVLIAMHSSIVEGVARSLVKSQAYLSPRIHKCWGVCVHDVYEVLSLPSSISWCFDCIQWHSPRVAAEPPTFLLCDIPKKLPNKRVGEDPLQLFRAVLDFLAIVRILTMVLNRRQMLKKKTNKNLLLYCNKLKSFQKLSLKWESHQKSCI